MPRGDKTGPRGEGPRTGRGLGECKPSTTEGQLGKSRKGLGPCGDGTPRGGGMGGCKGRRRGPNGVTYYT